MSDSNEGSSHQRRRGKKSSSRPQKETEPSDPQPVMLSQAQKDEHIKRKMADADSIANLALAVPDDPQKKKKKKKKKKNSNSRLHQDEKLKRKMEQADQIASSLLLDEPHSVSTVDEDPNTTFTTASYMAATMAPPVAGVVEEETERPVLPLEPSPRRVSKQRDSEVDSPGAYAIAGFNESSNSQDLVPDEELTDYLVFDDEHDDEESIHDLNDLMPAQEEFEDEIIQGSGSGRMSRSSGILSSGRFSGGSGRVSSSGGGSERPSSVRFSLDEKSSSGKSNDEEIFEADVVLAIDVNIEAETRENFSEKRQACRRIMVGAVMVVCLIVPVIVALGLILTRDNSNNDSPQAPSNAQSTATRTPTLSPTTSPAPTFTTIPVTVVIWFDDAPWETGWSLECDGAMIESFPIDSFNSKKRGDLFSETLRVRGGAECKFTIVDLNSDGLCCNAGRGFYQLYLAEEDEVPNGFVAKGSVFEDSETVEFVALVSENS